MTIPTDLTTWAIRHGISAEALADLMETLGAGTQGGASDGGSESRVQSRVRLAAPGLAMRLFRNNVGVLRNDRGVPVRYGLANDSKALNSRLKSGDLIGWRRRLITADMVGSVIAQFVSLECKESGWRYRGDEHEQAQQRWAALVAVEGGHARFVTGAEGMA